MTEKSKLNGCTLHFRVKKKGFFTARIEEINQVGLVVEQLLHDVVVENMAFYYLAFGYFNIYPSGIAF